MNIGKWYGRALETNPWRTKCLTAGLITFTGDTICQKMGKFLPKPKGQEDTAPKPFDLQRALKFSILGMIYIAPLLHFNYSLFLPRLVPTGTSYATLKKVMIDQSLFASGTTFGFFILINLMEGNTL